MKGHWLKVSAAIFSCLLILFCPVAAHAHLVQTGFGSFYDGAAHVAFTPEDLLLPLALGLLAGLRGAPTARSVVLCLPLAWGVGLLVGHLAVGAIHLSMVPLVSFGVIGGLAAFDLNLSRSVVSLLAVTAGFLHGYVNGVALPTSDVLLTSAGILTAATVLLLLCAALVVSLRQHWARIAARAAGSWLAAVGLLMCGWLARG